MNDSWYPYFWSSIASGVTAFAWLWGGCWLVHIVPGWAEIPAVITTAIPVIILGLFSFVAMGEAMDKHK